MATKAEIEAKAQEVKDKAQTIAMAETTARNLRDMQHHAQGRVREWQTRLAKDPSLFGFDLEEFEADLRKSEEAFIEASLASVAAARLRMEERTAHETYMQTQGRGELRS